jgi:phage gp29-like protein
LILDAYGRPIVFEALQEEQAAATLAGIRNIYSVIDDSVNLTPQKAVGILRTAEFGDPWLFLELAERMEEKDLLYQGVLHTRKMAVSQLDIDVSAADDSVEAQADAEYLREVLIEGHIDLHDTVYDILDSLGKGFSATEIIWDTNGTNQRTGAPEYIPAQLKWRDPRWFMFDWVSGEELLVRTLRTDGPELPVGRGSWDTRLNPTNFRLRAQGGHEVGIQPATQPLAPFKFITHVTRAKSGLAIRGGLARIAIWTYLFKNYILKDWITFAEVYGQPMRVGKYGPGATDIDKAALLQAVANIGTDAAAIIPNSMAIEFVESRGGGQKSHEMYERFCLYLDKLLTIGVLGQELTTSLPHGGGSRAAAEVHDVVRRDIATDDARRLCATLNRDLVKPLIDLNRGTRERYPGITIAFNEKPDLAMLMDGLGPAIDRGLRISEKWLRDQFGAPDPQDGEMILHPAERITSQEAAPAQASAIAGVPMSPAFTDVDGRELSAAQKKRPTRRWRRY